MEYENENFEQYLEGLKFLDSKTRNEIELKWNKEKYNLYQNILDALQILFY